jgi:hypothetical protein
MLPGMAWICSVCFEPWSLAGGGFCTGCGAEKMWIRHGSERTAPAPPALAREPPVRGAPMERAPVRLHALSPAAAAGVRLYSLDAVPDIQATPFDATLALALDGIMDGALIFVWGPSGSGKSTLAAELAASMCRATRRPTFWADGDQGNPALIRECFLRAGVPAGELTPDRLRVAGAFDRRDPRFKRIGWRQRFAAIPAGVGLVVVDSLQALAGQDDRKEQEALLVAAGELGPPVVVISETTKAGDPRGGAGNEFEGDANVAVSPGMLRVHKCRWFRRACPVEYERPALPER